MRLKKEIKDGKNADRAQVKPVRPMGNHLFTPHGPKQRTKNSQIILFHKKQKSNGIRAEEKLPDLLKKKPSNTTKLFTWTQ